MLTLRTSHEANVGRAAPVFDHQDEFVDHSGYVQQLFETPSLCGMEINRLRIQAKKQTILSVPELRLPKTGVVSFMGPSGSGKSTLLKALSELLDDNLDYEGEVSINGLGEQKPRRKRCSQYAMVWQRPTVFPCSIWDNLKIPLRKRKVERGEWLKMMEIALEKTGLLDELQPHWWKQRAQQLSGGQQQRLSIAMGLLKDACVFLFDEPTSALDPLSTEKVEHIISDLGYTKLVLLVTHSLGQARRVSDYCGMFYNNGDHGVLCEFSACEAFFEKPASPKSREFIRHETGIR